MKIRKNYIASNKNSEADAVHPNEDLLELLATLDDLRSFAVVTFQNATKFSFTSNSAFRLRNKVLVENGIVSANTAMRAFLVVKFQPHAKNVVELSSAKTNEVIQHFPLCSSDEALAKCVCHGSAWRNLYWPYVRLFPKCIEGIRALPIAIPNEKLRVDTFVLHPHRGVPRLLHYPSGIRMIGTRTAIDFSRTQMNKHEYICVTYPAQREYSLGKEIARNDAVKLGVNKGRPGDRRSLSSFLGIGKVTLSFKDVTDGSRSDADTQFLEFPKDTTVSPAKILPRESQDQVTRSKRCARSSGRLVGAPSTQLPQPLPVGFRYDDVHQFSNIMVHRRTQPKQLRPFPGSGHDTARVHPSAQDANLRLKKLNPSVVSGAQPLRHELHERENETIHRNSFRVGKSAKRPNIEGYTPRPMFSSLLDRGRIPSPRSDREFERQMRRNPGSLPESEFPVNSLLIWKGNRRCGA